MFLFFFFICPNNSWYNEHLILCIHIAETNHSSKCKIYTLEKPSCNGGLSSRKSITVILSSSFPLEDFRNWPWAPLDGWLSTTCIVLSLSLSITSTTKHWWQNASYTIFRISSASILLEIDQSYFGVHVFLILLPYYLQYHTFRSPFDIGTYQ